MCRGCVRGYVIAALRATILALTAAEGCAADPPSRVVSLATCWHRVQPAPPLGPGCGPHPAFELTCERIHRRERLPANANRSCEPAVAPVDTTPRSNPSLLRTERPGPIRFP